MSALKYACLKAKKNNADIEILSVLDTAHKGYALFAVDKVMDQENRDNQYMYYKKHQSVGCKGTYISYCVL